MSHRGRWLIDTASVEIASVEIASVDTASVDTATRTWAMAAEAGR